MGHFEVHTHEGSVLHLCTKFEADRSSYSKVKKSRPIRGRFMVHTQEGFVLYVCTKFEADLYSFKSHKVPNFRNWSRDPGHAHLGVVMVRTQEESVLYVGTKYEADSSIPSKVKGGPKISKFGRDPKPHPF